MGGGAMGGGAMGGGDMGGGAMGDGAMGGASAIRGAMGGGAMGGAGAICGAMGGGAGGGRPQDGLQLRRSTKPLLRRGDPASSLRPVDLSDDSRAKASMSLTTRAEAAFPASVGGGRCTKPCIVPAPPWKRSDVALALSQASRSLAT